MYRSLFVMSILLFGLMNLSKGFFFDGQPIFPVFLPKIFTSSDDDDDFENSQEDLTTPIIDCKQNQTMIDEDISTTKSRPLKILFLRLVRRITSIKTGSNHSFCRSSKNGSTMEHWPIQQMRECYQIFSFLLQCIKKIFVH